MANLIKDEANSRPYYEVDGDDLRHIIDVSVFETIIKQHPKFCSYRAVFKSNIPKFRLMEVFHVKHFHFFKLFHGKMPLNLAHIINSNRLDG